MINPKPWPQFHPIDSSELDVQCRVRKGAPIYPQCNVNSVGDRRAFSEGGLGVSRFQASRGEQRRPAVRPSAGKVDKEVQRNRTRAKGPGNKGK